MSKKTILLSVSVLTACLASSMTARANEDIPLPPPPPPAGYKASIAYSPVVSNSNVQVIEPKAPKDHTKNLRNLEAAKGMGAVFGQITAGVQLKATPKQEAKVQEQAKPKTFLDQLKSGNKGGVKISQAELAEQLKKGAQATKAAELADKERKEALRKEKAEKLTAAKKFQEENATFKPEISYKGATANELKATRSKLNEMFGANSNASANPLVIQKNYNGPMYKWVPVIKKDADGNPILDENRKVQYETNPDGSIIHIRQLVSPGKNTTALNNVNNSDPKNNDNLKQDNSNNNPKNKLVKANVTKSNAVSPDSANIVTQNLEEQFQIVVKSEQENSQATTVTLEDGLIYQSQAENTAPISQGESVKFVNKTSSGSESEQSDQEENAIKEIIKGYPGDESDQSNSEKAAIKETMKAYPGNELCQSNQEETAIKDAIKAQQEAQERAQAQEDAKIVAETIAESNVNDLGIINDAISSAVDLRTNDFASIGLSSGSEVIGVASGDSFIQPINIWVKGIFGHAKQKAYKGNTGFKTSHKGAVIGIDTILNDNNLVGIAYSHANIDAKLNTKISKVKTTANLLTAYWTINSDNGLFLNSQASYGKLKAQASGQHSYKRKGDTFSIKEELGYKINLEDGYQITPSVGISYQQVKFGKAEVKTPRKPYTIASSRNNRLAGFVGVDLSKAIKTKQFTIIPSINAGVEQVLNSKNKAVKVASSDEMFNTVGSRKSPAKTTYKVGGGLNIAGSQFEVGLKYDMMVRKKFTSHSGAISFKVKL